MRSRTARRSAAAGFIYLSAVLGIAGQVLAARELGPQSYGLLAIVLAAAGFAQSFLDLTVEEAVLKFGFRYVVAEQWGRLRRLFARAIYLKLAGGLLAALVLLAVAPAGGWLFGHDGLFLPLALAGLIPLIQSPEGVAANALLLRNRYDVRGFFNVVSMGTRFTALVVGSRIGVTETIALMVVAQAVSTVSLSAVGLNAYRRFPRVPAEPLGSDRAEVVSFMKQSSFATLASTLQGAIGPLLLGAVSNPTQVGHYRVALAPQTAFAAASSPLRLILLTEQTRQWEKGEIDVVFRALKRFSIGASLLMLVVLPPIIVFMRPIVELLYGASFAGAVDAARLVVAAAAITTIVGWSKSFPVSIGRPGLRVLTYSIQAAVLIPLTVLLGMQWGATGAATALLVSSGVYAGVWAVIAARLSRDRHLLRSGPAAA